MSEDSPNVSPTESDYAKSFDDSELSTLEKLDSFPRFISRPELSKFLFRWEIFKKVIGIQGSIVECGVYLGAGIFSFANFSTMLEPYNYQRKVIGFDTFIGFPGISSHDTSTNIHIEERREGGLFVNDCVFDELRHSIAVYDRNRYLSSKKKIDLVRGNVEDTVPKYLKDNPYLLISILYLDLDLYEGTYLSLRYLYDRVVPGGVVVFDELNDARWPGETESLIEYFETVPSRLSRLPFEPSASFFIKP